MTDTDWAIVTVALASAAVGWCVGIVMATVGWNRLCERWESRCGEWRGHCDKWRALTYDWEDLAMGWKRFALDVFKVADERGQMLAELQDAVRHGRGRKP